jgi:hypothetical protein
MESEMRDHPIRLDSPDPVQARMIRAFSGPQRLQLAAGLCRSVRRMLRAYLADQHPDWGSDRLEREITRRIAGGSSPSPVSVPIGLSLFDWEY